MADNRDWFVETYDRFVFNDGDSGSTVEKSRDGMAHAYADAVESGQIERLQRDVVDEGRELFDQYVGPVRERRKNHMRKGMEYLLDALADNTVLGLDDPVLKQAFPLGDGTDKCLFYWTVDDWQASRTERYRNAGDVMRAAQGFDEDIAQPFIDALRSRGSRITGDLFA